jgi:hypothetical protein
MPKAGRIHVVAGAGLARELAEELGIAIREPRPLQWTLCSGINDIELA